MNIKREAESRLLQFLSNKKVGIILGARQVGKTTLIKSVLKNLNTVFINFDNENEKTRFNIAKAMPPEQVRTYFGNPDYLVIDEAQRLPECARTVKGWYDSQVPFKVFLLGSSSLDLLNQSAESLTGRNRKLALTPLLMREAISIERWYSPYLSESALIDEGFSQYDLFLRRRMAYGCYPEVVTSDQPEEILKELSSDYLWKDILQTGLVKHPDLIKRLLILLAYQVGNEYSSHELSTQLQTPRSTIERYLDLLEQTFVIFRLNSFSGNPRKEVSKGKKIYFWDNGIRNALLNAFSLDEMRPDIGAIWENFVISEMAKQNALLGYPNDLYFWRTRSQSEVDLVIKQGEKMQAFEIKWSPLAKVRTRAFHDAYGVTVQLIHHKNPAFAFSLLQT